MSTEEIPGSISFCLAMLKKGDQAAAQRLWARYFHRLVSLAPRDFEPSPAAAATRRTLP